MTAESLSAGSHYHHHVVPLARISLTLSCHFSLSFIASGRSSGLHPVSSHSCWMYVRAGRPAFARPYVGVQRSTSLMSSSLLLQQYSACLVRLTWIVFVMGGRWPYSWCQGKSINANMPLMMRDVSMKIIIATSHSLKFSVESAGFRSQLRESSVSCHTEVAKQRNNLWMIRYASLPPWGWAL